MCPPLIDDFLILVPFHIRRLTRKFYLGPEPVELNGSASRRVKLTSSSALLLKCLHLLKRNSDKEGFIIINYHHHRRCRRVNDVLCLFPSSSAAKRIRLKMEKERLFVVFDSSLCL